jgi:Flp pilus assembly protein TadG
MKTIPGLFFFLLRLAKDGHARGHRLLARLLRDEEGAWLISMTIMLPVLIGVAGLGTEGGMLFYQHRSLQSAADAAAYSAALACSYSYTTNPTTCAADITTQAQAAVASCCVLNGSALNGFALGIGTNQANVTASATTFASQPAVQVTISRPQTAIFSSILFSVFPNSVSATAVINTSNGSGNCMLALGKTSTSPPSNAPDALQLQGTPIINAPGCGIFSDSNDCTPGAVSVALGGNATIDAGSLGTAGCVSLGGNSNINIPYNGQSTGGAYTHNDGPISDPYAGIILPSSPAPPCVPQPASATLNPGRYCGLNVNGSSVTLNPGTYILDCSASTCPTAQGTAAMLIVKNATLTGAGVTLVFTCSTCSTAPWPSNGILVAANGIVNLTAPATGATLGVPGFVMMGDPAMPLGTVFDVHSNPTMILTGTVYVPNGAFTWGGNASTGSNFCLELIANTITLSGTGSASQSSFSSCPLSGSGQKPIGSIVTLVD